MLDKIARFRKKFLRECEYVTKMPDHPVKNGPKQSAKDTMLLSQDPDLILQRISRITGVKVSE